MKLFKNARSNNNPVNGNVIKEKTLSLAKSFEDFRASDGWADKWKQRHNVTLQGVSGEENAATSEITASWNNNYLPTILTKYELKNIYKANEFGLSYVQISLCTGKVSVAVMESLAR